MAHHLIGLHGQLHFVITVLLTLAVGTLDLPQVLHPLLRYHVLHRLNVSCCQAVNLCFLVWKKEKKKKRKYFLFSVSI